jgi:membrane protease YdiL (CAAX protease family)
MSDQRGRKVSGAETVDYAFSLAAPERRSLPVILFLLGTFLWAWVLWGYWVFAMPPGGLVVTPAFIACAIIGGLAPSLAALAVSYGFGGREAVIALIAPLSRWRIGWSVATVALLLAPIATGASVLLQAWLIGPLKWPQPSLLALALVWPLFAALGEELGWRGYLFPRLALRLDLIAAAILVGLIWGLWHLPADYVALKGYGGWFIVAFLLNGPVVLAAHAIIMAWIWSRTGGSTFAAVLYHVSITASAIVAPTAGSDGLPGILAAACGTGVMWLAALTLLIFRRSEFDLNGDRNERN